MPGSHLRLATFNVENLFARYRFRSNQPPTLDETGFTINNLAFDIYNEVDKRITAQAIKEVNADVLCLQEVESLPVLDRFVAGYLPRMGYRHRVLIDGNDPRFIDVAVLSREPITSIRTHRHERAANRAASLFSRDCLRVDIAPKAATGGVLTVYVNHFKSMMGGRAETRGRREEQVQGVVDIVDGDWQSANYEGNFAVVGDFNDYVDAQTSLSALVGGKFPNLLERAPKTERWTHYYAGRGQYSQLDYILLGNAFDQRAGKPTPMVMRKGLPWRADDYDGPRFEEVGERNPKASDHAALYVDLAMSSIV